MRTAWQRIKEWDVQKQFPGYFCKWIFRAGFLLVFIYVIAMLSSTWGTWNYVYYECNDPICNNPYYVCTPQDTDYGRIYRSTCWNEVDAWICDQGMCDKKVLVQGESLGQKPPVLVRYFSRVFVLLLVLMFVINHAFYAMRRSKK